MTSGKDRADRVGSGRPVGFVAGLLKQHAWLSAAAVVLNVLAACFEGSTMGILALALESLFGEGDRPAFLAPGSGPGRLFEDALSDLGRQGLFLALVGLAVGSQILRSATQFGARCAAAGLQAQVEANLRRRLVRKFMSLSFAQVRDYRVGDLTALMDQVTYAGHVMRVGNLMLAHSLTIIAYGVVLWWLFPAMTVGVLLGMALLAALLRRVVARIKALGATFTDSSVRLTEHTVEVLNGLRLIRSFGREDFAVKEADAAIEDSRRARFHGLVLQSAVAPLIEILAVLGVAAFLIAGITVTGGSQASLPRLIAFLVVLARLLPRIKLVNDRLGVVMSYWQYVRRLHAVITQAVAEPSRVGKAAFGRLRDRITFDRVGLRYAGGDRPAVDGVSFDLPKGRMVALVGESGAGKSSLADLLIGLYRPTRGRILVDGRDLQEIDWSDWRERLGVVSQDTFVLHASVRSNIAFGRPEASREEIESAARAAFCHDFIQDLPGGYDHVIGDRGHGLSGGQRQRLAIARAFVRDPEVLILDEATSELDPESELAIRTALESLRAERTVLVIAHRLSTVRRADEILVLEAGRIVERGTHGQLVSAGGRYSRLRDLQMGGAGDASSVSSSSPTIDRLR